MTDITERLQDESLLMNAEDVSKKIVSDENIAISGFGSVGYPKVVPETIAANDQCNNLTVISGGSVGEEIDRDLMGSGAISRRIPYQARSTARKCINKREVHFNDRHIWPLGDEVAYQQLVNSYIAIVEAVAVGEDWIVPSTSIGPTPSYIQSADKVFVELNYSQPLELCNIHDIVRREPPPNRKPVPLNSAKDRIGSPKIKFDGSKLEGIVETNRPDSPYEFRELKAKEKQIGSNLVSFLNDELASNALFDEKVHLQFGVGNVGNALMDKIQSIVSTDRNLIYYGEVIQDGLLNMIDNGTITTASATSLALSAEGQARLFDEIARYSKHIVLRQSSVSNNPSIINRLGVIGINSAAEVDIYGNVNSTHVNGTHILNGIGGSGDFIRNSLLSIVALPSTLGDTQKSRIVPMVPHLDHTEHDVSVIITENGVADLRGKSPTERAALIIEECAHASFRDKLYEYLERVSKSTGHTPHDLDSVFTMMDSESN